MPEENRIMKPGFHFLFYPGMRFALRNGGKSRVGFSHEVS